MSNTFDKLSVLDSFIEEVNSYLPDIESNLEHLTQLAQSPQPGSDMDALEETYRRAHTIGGSASMMDFPGLAHVAHGMEDILGDIMDGLTVLDEPTVRLLQRSLGRLHTLIDGIRVGINEDKIIAEDDADYTQYRAHLNENSAVQIQSPTPAGQSMYSTPADEGKNEAQESDFSVPPTHASNITNTLVPSMPTMPSQPSFDEVLASFRTPSISSVEEDAWPEEVAPTATASQQEEMLLQPTQPFSPVKPNSSSTHSSQEATQSQLPATPEATVQSSALDTLVASTRQQSSVPPEQSTHIPVEQGGSVSPNFSLPTIPESNRGEPVAQPAKHTIDEASLPGVYIEAQDDVRALETQASSLHNIVAQLHSAMSLIEAQRSEFRGFLDGSKDALDRMEDWAGKAMGLNLRNSPEQVRRYLPLSVMWVSNSKLKKILELLDQVASGVESTDEQICGALQQLQVSIAACGEAFQQMQEQAMVAHVLTHEQGWTPWEMQVAHSEQATGLQERVTFERRGDPDALRAEVEAHVRAELQREYESSPISSTARAEIEQQVRNDVMRELEEKQRLQEQVTDPEQQESLKELEARLRNEIEIQVRQELLNQIGLSNEVNAGHAIPTLPSTSMPTLSNFTDRALQATEMSGHDANSARSQQTMPSKDPVVSSQPAKSTVTTPPENITKPLAPAAPAAESSTTFAPGNDFGEEAAEIFRLEAEEHLQTISTYVAALEKEPTNQELIQGIRRAMHTLKGAAGMMGFRAIADLSHISEDLLDSIMEKTTPISPAVLSLILDTVEALDILITGRDANQMSEEARVQALRTRYIELLGEDEVSTNALDVDEDLEVEGEESGERITDTALVTGIIADNQMETNAQRAVRADLSVRVRLQKLDELINLFGELLVNRSVLEERLGRLTRLVADVGISSNRLHDVGQKLESRFEAATLPSGHSVTVMPGQGNQSADATLARKNGKDKDEPSHLSDFDELELDRYTEFHQIARGLSEGISDMATLSTEMDTIIRECEGVFARENRLNTTFQDRLMKARLVPLSTMTPRLYRTARAVAFKQGKEFEFMLEGEETEVDRTVFEEIAGPLQHLMRNAVNHAIETPDIRVQHSKPPVGRIILSASYEGNQVVITVRDDGKGIDPETIRGAAIARGLVRPDHFPSQNELIELIFRPGFSTAETLSEESGRGVGLDVVRDSVSRLRGTIEVESTPGRGTAFTMKFPTSLAIQSAIMVRVSDQQFAIPTVAVESVGRLDIFKRTTSAGQPAVLVHNDVYPLSVLAQYLSLPVGQINEKAQVLLVNAGGNRVALVVDEVKGKSDIVTKNLGPHLRNVHGIAGGTVLGNGQVVLILELVELLSTRAKLVANVTGNAVTSLRRDNTAIFPTQIQQNQQLAMRQGSAASLVPPTPSSIKPSGSTMKVERGKYILVVDDSPSVRRVVSSMLKQHNWEVQLARDGIEALEMITRETPAAVLLDVEMPRMDGYELIATVRAQEQYRTLPLIMLTSRAAAKHQQRAMQLGASAYIIKPYQDEELLNTINSLVYNTAIVR